MNERLGALQPPGMRMSLTVTAIPADERVPTGQAYELYRGLKDRGKTTELVFYPREGHGFTEYYHQRDRMQRIYDWVTKYTLGTGGNRTTSQQ